MFFRLIVLILMFGHSEKLLIAAVDLTCLDKAEFLLGHASYKEALESFSIIQDENTNKAIINLAILGKTRCLYYWGRYPEALRILNELLISPPIDSTILFKALMFKADVHYFDRQYLFALGEYLSLVNKFPDHPSRFGVELQIVKSFMKLERFVDAEDYLSRMSLKYFEKGQIAQMNYLKNRLAGQGRDR